MIVVILIIITIITVYINYNIIKTGGLFNRYADSETFDHRTPELEELKLILTRLEDKKRKKLSGIESDIKIYKPETLDDPLLYPDDIKKILQEIDDYVEKNYNKLSDYEKSRKRLLIDTETVTTYWDDQTKREYGIYTYAKSVIDNYLLLLSRDQIGKWEWKLRYPLCFQEILNKLKVFAPGTLESLVGPISLDEFYNSHF
jgi:hypothetical protein